MSASDAQTEVVLTQTVVRDTLRRGCAPDGCFDLGGSGVISQVGARVGLRQFFISRNSQCGVQIAEGGTVDLEDGEVSFNEIGVNVQTEGFDLQRIEQGVVYRENRVNLDALVLPLPEAGSRISK